jgi:hypothetical protein
MVKRQREEKGGIPVDQQGLSYEEKRLQDDHTVQSCNITNDAIFSIVNNDISVIEGKKTAKRRERKIQALER